MQIMDRLTKRTIDHSDLSAKNSYCFTFPYSNRAINQANAAKQRLNHIFFSQKIYSYIRNKSFAELDSVGLLSSFNKINKLR